VPTRPPRACTQPGCGATTLTGGRCPTHRSERNRAIDSRRDPNVRAFYSSRQWQVLRRIALAREVLCRECARHGRTTVGREVDHVIPREDGGLDVIENLQVLCSGCHSRKSLQEMLAKRKR